MFATLSYLGAVVLAGNIASWFAKKKFAGWILPAVSLVAAFGLIAVSGFLSHETVEAIDFSRNFFNGGGFALLFAGGTLGWAISKPQ